MKKTFIVANWKSYKTIEEVALWFDTINQFPPISEEKEIIVCAPFIFASEIHNFIKDKKLSIRVGVQNISSFDEGAYTGEVFARQIVDFATHAIIGHSERRKYFHETDEDIIAKLKQLIRVGITPVLCIGNMEQLDCYLSQSKIILENLDRIIFVYEPPSAISGGKQFCAETPESIDENVKQIAQKIGKKATILYGGSINSKNARSIFALEGVDGGLVGQASLDASEFYKIIENA